MAEMTLEEFVQTYSHSPLDDEEYAEAIVRLLPADLPLVKAAQAFLDACKAFDAAVDAAGLERD
jgi:hypothetical protein